MILQSMTRCNAPASTACAVRDMASNKKTKRSSARAREGTMSETLYCSECGTMILGHPLLILARRGKRPATQAVLCSVTCGHALLERVFMREYASMSYEARESAGGDDERS